MSPHERARYVHKKRESWAVKRVRDLARRGFTDEVIAKEMKIPEINVRVLTMVVREEQRRKKVDENLYD